MTAAFQPASGDHRDLRSGFDVFYKETVDRTFRAAYRAAGGDREIARDATQEAYLAMLRILIDRGPARDPARYVVGIAVKKVVDAYRASARYDRWVDNYDPPIEEVGFAQVTDDVSVIRLVIEFLNRQPPQQRAVGVLYFLEELTYNEISTALDGMSLSTARTHVQRLRQKLAPLVKQIAANIEGGESR
jgi:RNA polymerase sigma factor (sigma-70 family)